MKSATWYGSKTTWLWFVVATFFLTACNSTKLLTSNQYLLSNVVVKVKPSVFKSQLVPIIKQKPNRKILGGIPFHLSAYNLGYLGKVDSAGNRKGFNRWLMQTVGEPPVILDTFLTTKSSNQIKQYMQNCGYFNVQVTDTVLYKKNKHATVIYKVIPNQPYIVDSFYFKISDTKIDNFLKQSNPKSELQKGQTYNATILQKERERITKILRNIGYYDFTQQYVHFLIDSSFKSNKVVVMVIVDNPEMDQSSNSVNDMFHKQFYINKTFILPQFEVLEKQNALNPTDTILKNRVYFLINTNKPMPFKKHILEQHVFLNAGGLYKQKDVDLTYQRLQDLGVFRFINIIMEPLQPIDINDTINTDNDTARLVNAFIQLTKADQQDYAIENEVTTSGGNIGIAGSVTYRHKNFFYGTELFEFKVRGAVSSQPDFTSNLEVHEQNLLKLNTFELGAETRLTFHQFLLPFKTSQNEKYFEPTTRLTANFNTERRVEYNRNISTVSLSYAYRRNPKIRHFIYPVEFNFVSVTTTSAYQQRLDSLKDQAILYSYSDHLISSGRYSMTYNNQYIGLIKNIFFFRFNFELAGNTLYLYDKIANTSPSATTGNFQRLGVDYAQYGRPDIDLRYYQVFNKYAQLVYRLQAGVVMPYGNNTDVLFEKAFFCGGSIDNRAFQPYTIGPGGYKPTTTIQQFGSIKLAFNFEHRFDIFKLLQGAAFIDGGNVWLNQPDPNRPLADFNVNRFYNEFAIGAGLGARLNFNFFIIRLDAALPVKDPSRPIGNRFVLNEITMGNVVDKTTFNLGIGYPF